MSQDVAIGIVNALRSGTVPLTGLEHLAVGVDVLRDALRDQRDFVGRGHSAYKFIRGSYGSGKTFLTSLACADAVAANFVATQIVVSVADTPLYDLAQIYRRLCQGLSTRVRAGGALSSIVDRWLYNLEQQVIEVDAIPEEDPRFPAAVARKVETALRPVGLHAGRLAACLKAYHDAQYHRDFGERQGILDWMSGEPKVSAAIKRMAGVTGTLDNTDALEFLRGWLELLRSCGFAGLLVVLDEVEIVLRMRRPERLKSLEVLRLLVDECDANRFPGLQLLITGTPDFFESHSGVPSLEPLHDRIRVDFTERGPDNLRQAQVRLHPFDRPRLTAVARRVREIYPARRREDLVARVSDTVIEQLIESVTAGFGGHVEVVPRLFLREFVNVLDLVDQDPDYSPAAACAFNGGGLSDLRPQEESAIHDAVRDIAL